MVCLYEQSHYNKKIVIRGKSLIKILFVCLGNICRSPAAEAIMNNYLKKAGLSDQISCDSAGTSSGHVGQSADTRMQLAAKTRGYSIHHTARQLNTFDLIESDYIIAMDQNNYCDIRDQAFDEEGEKKIHIICSFCSEHSVREVPDPYWNYGDEGFNIVLDILEDACWGLLQKIKADFSDVLIPPSSRSF